MAVALALTVLMICLVGRISAHYGLSVLGIGDLGGGLGGRAVPAAALCGRRSASPPCGAWSPVSSADCRPVGAAQRRDQTG